MGLEVTFTFVTLVVSFVISVYLLKFYNSRTSKFMRRLRGPPRLPIVGNMFEVNVPNEEVTLKIMREWPDKYGPRFGIQLGPRNYFTSITASDVEKLLSSSTHIKKGDEYRFIAGWLGEGLLTSTGSKWFRRRKLLTPSFHFKILEEFLDIFNVQAKTLVEEVQSDSAGGKEPLEICQYITRCTLDIICETAMGKSINAQRLKDSPYVKAIYGICDLLQHRTVRPWLYPDFLWALSPSGRLQKQYLKTLHGFTNKVITERKAEMSKEQRHAKNSTEDTNADVFMGKKRAVAFMDLLLQHQAENPGELTDADIREETDTFMFEGHDTTAASLSWTIHLLGANPDCQAKVVEELESIFGDDKERPVTAQDLAQMKYLECCIKESLRLYPSVPYIDRYLTSDLKLDDDTVVPAGFNFPVFIIRLHRDPVIFPEPEAFKPERFFPENLTGRHPYAYVPFSAGPRNCIGQKFALMEEKVVLAHLFRNYKVEALDKTDDIVLMTELILRPRDGLNVRCTRRK